MQEDSDKHREALRALDILQNQTGDDISYSSFLAAMIACTKLEETLHAAKSAFRRFDHTDSGYLSPEKLREVARLVWKPLIYARHSSLEEVILSSLARCSGRISMWR